VTITPRKISPNLPINHKYELQNFNHLLRFSITDWKPNFWGLKTSKITSFPIFELLIALSFWPNFVNSKKKLKRKSWSTAACGSVIRMKRREIMNVIQESLMPRRNSFTVHIVLFSPLQGCSRKVRRVLFTRHWITPVASYQPSRVQSSRHPYALAEKELKEFNQSMDLNQWFLFRNFCL
jgi:hypothetical protein